MELHLACLNLAPTAAALAQLERLILDDCLVQGDTLDLAVSAPRLVELTCSGSICCGFANASAGHTALRELLLELECVIEGADVREWGPVLGQLPQLSSLMLNFDESIFGDGPAGDVGGAGSRLALLAEWLRPCTQLARLKLDAEFEPPLHQVLAAVGAAVGESLVSLELGHALLPASPADAARAFYALPLHYPRLKQLSVLVECTSGESADAADAHVAADAASLLALLRPLDVLLPACSALSALELDVHRMGGRRAPEFGRVRDCWAALSAAHPGKLKRLGL